MLLSLSYVDSLVHRIFSLVNWRFTFGKAMRQGLRPRHGGKSRIDTEDQEVTVVFDDRRVVYDYSDLDELVLAYAVTVHKSQGSEYPCVVIPLLTRHYVMLQRNLIYTAITRGKRLVILVGSKRALAIAVKNNTTQNRYADLMQKTLPPCLIQTRLNISKQ